MTATHDAPPTLDWLDQLGQVVRWLADRDINPISVTGTRHEHPHHDRAHVVAHIKAEDWFTLWGSGLHVTDEHTDLVNDNLHTYVTGTIRGRVRVQFTSCQPVGEVPGFVAKSMAS